MFGGVQRRAQTVNFAAGVRELRTGVGLVVACACEANRVEVLLVESHDWCLVGAG